MKIPMSKQMMKAAMIAPMTIAATSPEVRVLQVEPLTIGTARVPVLLVRDPQYVH